MTMSDNEVQSPNSTQESLTVVTENGFSSGQEVNKVKYSADGGGSMVEMTKSDSTSGENCARLKAEQSSSSGKPKRTITFPQDSCVSGYCEPPDPWKRAPKWTVQDVLTAYRKSCDKHGTKPLTKVLQQVEAFSCNGKRADKLVLKGEKIDMKQCETFEEILRRVQFKTLDMEGCHLDDETAVALFDMVEFYESAQTLNISFNKNIGVRGWQACSRLIRRTPCLTTLDLRNCDMNDRSIPLFGRALKLGSHLTVLHMENMYLSGRSLILLVAALKMNEILQELFLADNRLMPSDGIQLGNLLKYNHALTLLDLRNNHLQDVGVGHLCDGLYEQNLDKGLRTLVLWNNQVTFQAMASLSRAMGSTKCLETLNLGHNNVTNEGIHNLKEGLLKSKSLMRLGLQSTKLTCEGAVALAEYVADSLHLLRLDLRENDIKTAGLMALSLALKVNNTVTRIDLDKETKKETGMKDYADQQRRLQQEINSYLERNQQAVLSREEEERRCLEERAQVEMAARASVQSAITSAQQAIQAHPEMMYVPTPVPEPEETVRPSLLFQPHRLTPQESLESPHCTEVEFFSGKKSSGGESPQQGGSTTVSSPPLTLELANPLTATQPAMSVPCQGMSDPTMALPRANPTLSHLRSPPPELLLSPQYYPRPTARKIFSVSRVMEASIPSPTVSKTGVLDTGATGTSTTPTMRLAGGSSGVGSTPSPISPTLLCQDLSAKTVSDYIQQIVADPQILTTVVEGARSGSFDTGTLEGQEEETVGQETLPAVHTVFSIDDEEGSSCSLDPLGVMPVESGSVNCDSVATFTKLPSNNLEGITLSDCVDAVRTTTTPSDGLAADATTLSNRMAAETSPLSGTASITISSVGVEDPSSTKCSLLDLVNLYGNKATGSCSSQKDQEEEKGVGSVDGSSGGVDLQSATFSLQGEAVSTNCDPELHCIPQSSLVDVVGFCVDDLTNIVSEAPTQSSDTSDSPSRTEPAQPQDHPDTSLVLLSLEKDNFLSELDKLDREWDSQEESSTKANRNTNFEALAQPQSVPQSLLDDSSLFRTMEFPDFDINDDDLSLFGAATSSKQKAASLSQVGEKGKRREVSPSLGDTWMTVDAASLGERSELEKEEEPDFFTSLSMNGLTQELASVLSSIDGKVDMDSQDMNTPDEFERELDAMLAIVKSDLPWPLQKTQCADSAADTQQGSDDNNQSCA